MTRQQPPPPAAGERSREAYGDPWQAFGYVVSGVVLYGVVGWLLDRWLGTSWLVAIGIFLGAGLGIYMTMKRFGTAGTTSAPPDGQTGTEE